MQRQTLLDRLLNVFTARRGQRTIQLLDSPLAGFQHHRAAGIWPFLRRGERLRLVREPHNPHDANAVAVYFKNDRLGYVPRRENRALAAMLDRGERIEACITGLRLTNDPWQRLQFTVELHVRPIADMAMPTLRRACTPH